MDRTLEGSTTQLMYAIYHQDHRNQEPRALKAHTPPRYNNKQRGSLFKHRNCPLFLEEKMLSKCRAPKCEVLSTALTKMRLIQKLFQR